MIRSLNMFWVTGILAVVFLSAGTGKAASGPGAKLFSGRAPLKGHVEGHTESMPTLSTACIGCHNSTKPLGPVLTNQSLTGAVPRRGGPASTYDGASFCRVLRTGIDPSFILLRKEMPRYQISDGQCTSLWRFLTHDGK